MKHFLIITISLLFLSITSCSGGGSSTASSSDDDSDSVAGDSGDTPLADEVTLDETTLE